MLRKGLIWIVYLLVLGGGLLVGDGLWLRAKAVVAQLLLQNAWQETRATGTAVKPWPWADSWPVARLRVQHLDVDCIILAGTSGEVLAFAPGHLKSSTAPGQPGNSILAGHRDTSFAFLKDLQVGDMVTVEDTSGRYYDFQVTAMQVEHQDNLFFEQPDSPWLTLITCYPFDDIVPGGPLRYVIFARLTKRTRNTGLANHTG